MDKFEILLKKLNSMNIKPIRIDYWEEEIEEFDSDFFNNNFLDDNGKLFMNLLNKK